jgi:DNA modification methylase
LIICGDALTELRKLPDESVNMCVTSPPYWGLRDYGVPGQLGLEKTPEEYVAHLVEVFREVRRVLKKDGTLWLNLGDSYAGSGKGMGPNGASDPKQPKLHGMKVEIPDLPPGLKPKDLVGIPWRVAFALQADGWWLRQDIIWAKPNPMPESVRDRCTKAHEYIFMLTKSARYFYDAEAVAEESNFAWNSSRGFGICPRHKQEAEMDADRFRTRGVGTFHPDKEQNTRNLRSVWIIATRPYAEAHFATFPPEIPERCIKAGCPKGGTILDPFFGAGTTGLVAMRLGREFIGIELNEKYCEMAKKRIYGTLGAEATQ